MDVFSVCSFDGSFHLSWLVPVYIDIKGGEVLWLGRGLIEEFRRRACVGAPKSVRSLRWRDTVTLRAPGRWFQGC